MKSTAISRSILVLLLPLFTVMMSTAPAGAQATDAASNYTFVVNTTADTHDIKPGDGACADSNGNCSLRAATEEADALPSGSTITITVPAGTYGLALGALSLTANTITINGAASKTTIIKGNQTFGIMAVSSASPVQLNQLTIEGGNSSDYGGGIDNSGTLTVSNSAITTNVGSGIYNGGTLTISNSAITANSDPYGGGGIYNDGSNGGTLTVSNSIITANSATGSNGGGGGIYNIYYGTVSISNSTISGNSAAGNSGGGIYSLGYHGGSNVNISNSTISGNSASSGGGIDEDSADITVSNSTISGNSATAGDGGGIDMPNSNGGTVIVSNSTISGNSATGKGGAIANDNINGRITLNGTIVANSKGAPNCHGKITDKGYNLDSGSSCSFHSKTDLNKTNPALGPLRDNGGPTKTMALRKGSKAIDWIALTSCPTTDQRGHKRPDNNESACDIGAYESSH